MIIRQGYMPGYLQAFFGSNILNGGAFQRCYFVKTLPDPL
jgi:hypothetical protein